MRMCIEASLQISMPFETSDPKHNPVKFLLFV